VTDDRRTRILDAVETLLGRGGVEAVTMRGVAAEAGTSLRLVQYYGHTKDELLTAALHRMADQSIARWHAATEGPASAEQSIRAFLEESLPTDEPSRAFHRVGVSLEQLAISRPDAAARAYRRHLTAVQRQLADALRGDARVTETQAQRLAVEAMALGHGLGTMLMAEQVSPTEVEAVVSGHLARLTGELGG